MLTFQLPPIRCYRCDGLGYLWDHLDDVEFYTPCPCIRGGEHSAEVDAVGDHFDHDEACRSTVMDEARAPRSPEMTREPTLGGSVKASPQLIAE